MVSGFAVAIGWCVNVLVVTYDVLSMLTEPDTEMRGRSMWYHLHEHQLD